MKLLLVMAMFMTSQAFAAQEYTILCERAGNDYIGQFDLVGMIHQNDDGSYSSDGVFSVVLRDNGRDAQDIDSVIQVTGKVKVHPAGVFARHEVVQFTYTDKTGDIRMININGDFPGLNTSTIRVASGRVYKSQCKID